MFDPQNADILEMLKRRCEFEDDLYDQARQRVSQGQLKRRQRLYAMLGTMAVSRFFNGARYGDAVRRIIYAMEYGDRTTDFFVDFLCYGPDFIRLVCETARPNYVARMQKKHRLGIFQAEIYRTNIRNITVATKELQRIWSNVVGKNGKLSEAKLQAYIECRRSPENRKANAH